MNFHTLIASDIDGTLIPEETTVIPEAVFAQVRAAHERGVLFVAASGRQYYSLRALFEPVVEQMAFLIENGSALFYQDKMIHADVFPRDVAIDIAKYVQATPNCEFLADGEGDSCVIPKSERFMHQLLEVQKLSIRRIDSFDQFPEKVMKIAVWCTDGADCHAAAFEAAYGHCAHIAVSGRSWIDFSASTKGAGVQAACRIFGIPEECTYAFGDNWNDVTMLDAVRHPYIMATARPQLLERYPNVCTSVPREMQKIFEKM